MDDGRHGAVRNGNDAPAADEERQVCGATSELPLTLALAAVHITEEDQDALDLIDPTLRCTLGPHRGRHRDLVLDTDGEDSAVWTSWRNGELPTSVEILKNCGASNGLAAGSDDVCTHYSGHPDEHSWALFDPVLAYIDEHMPGALLRAAAPFLLSQLVCSNPRRPPDAEPRGARSDLSRRPAPDDDPVVPG
ncbi:hypothetical protein ABZ766_12600 [Streptomyces sp. NPDC006670]|uniref:hypothetical protein n=1 Tax=Streptomyces sp. NPDC006670 TaxID=3154476 RepID=UPI0033D78A28